MINKEIGHAGIRRYGGVFYEEFLSELQGRKGVEAYKEMSENDDVVGTILFAMEMLIRNVDWTVEAGGTSDTDKYVATFVESCLHDMEQTWTDTLSEILSFLTFGWSAHEIVYKRRMGLNKDPYLRSKYSDGLIGWKKLPIRSQETLYQWEYDSEENLIALTQQPPPSYRLITIPIDKLLLFRAKSRKDNPEGRSILRNAYRSWVFKRRIQEIEGIGIERDLAGFPTLVAPPDVDVWNVDDPAMIQLRVNAESLIKNIRRDSMEGIVLPANWKLELLSTGSRRNFDTNTIIERYDTRIAMTVLADFVMLGHKAMGTYALSSDKTELFSLAIGAFLDIISEVFNSKAIPQLIEVNGGKFKGMTQYPRLVHGDIETQDLDKLGNYLRNMMDIGLLTPDESLEDFIRRQGCLPQRIGDFELPVTEDE